MREPAILLRIGTGGDYDIKSASEVDEMAAHRTERFLVNAAEAAAEMVAAEMPGFAAAEVSPVTGRAIAEVVDTLFRGIGTSLETQGVSRNTIERAFATVAAERDGLTRRLGNFPVE